MMHQSIATIDSPEFINLQPLEINPLMSSCEIKVIYTVTDNIGIVVIFIFSLGGKDNG